MRAQSREKTRRNKTGRSIEEIVLSRSLDPFNPSSWPDVKKSAKLILPKSNTKVGDKHFVESPRIEPSPYFPSFVTKDPTLSTGMIQNLIEYCHVLQKKVQVTRQHDF